MHAGRRQRVRPGMTPLSTSGVTAEWESARQSLLREARQTGNGTKGRPKEKPAPRLDRGAPEGAASLPTGLNYEFQGSEATVEMPTSHAMQGVPEKTG